MERRFLLLLFPFKPMQLWGLHNFLGKRFSLHHHFGCSSAGGTMDQRYKPGRLDLCRKLARQSALDSLLKADLVLPASHFPLCRRGSIPLLTLFPLLECPSLLPPHIAKKSLCLLCLQSLLRYPMTTTLWAIPCHVFVL